MKTTLRHPKARGELTEIRFMLLAAACGFIVCKPYGDNEPFDFIVYCKRTQRFFRIQVKSCTSRCKGGYAISTKRSFGRKYTSRHADLIAAYVIPEDVWYLIPIAALGGRKSIYVYPRRPNSRGMFQPYREAWQLLRK